LHFGPGVSDCIASAASEALDLLGENRLEEAWSVAERGWESLDPAAPPGQSIQHLATARALVALARGDHAKALAVVQDGARRGGESADLHLTRGWALEVEALRTPFASPERNRLLDEAAQELRTCLTLEALSPAEERVLGDGPWIVWTRLGAVQLARGHACDALSSFRRALELCPDHVEARLGAAEALLRASEPREALAMVQPILLRAPDAWALAAFAAAALGSADDTALFLGRAFARQDWVSPAWRERADTLRAGMAAAIAA
jgi:tetratricopeptide (TPR) repeat protein